MNPQTREQILEVVSTNLTAKQKRLGLTYREMGKEIGVDHTVIWSAANSVKLPNRENLLRILRWLGISLESTMGLDRRIEQNLINQPLPILIRQILEKDSTLDEKGKSFLGDYFQFTYERLSV